jgi:hypothetical protein
MNIKNLRHVIFFLAVIVAYIISVILTNEYINCAYYCLGLITGYSCCIISKHLIEE